MSPCKDSKDVFSCEYLSIFFYIIFMSEVYSYMDIYPIFYQPQTRFAQAISSFSAFFSVHLQ